MNLAVSVIVPAYNTPANYFEACLKSLAAQTFNNSEFLIIFDGKQPKLEKICQEYSFHDSRFTLHSLPHKGVSAARNHGINIAQGEYVTFLDSDDTIEENCCLETYEFAKTNNADVVLFDYHPVDNQYEKKTPLKNSADSINNDIAEEFQKQCIRLTDPKYVSVASTWCKLIRKNFLLSNNITFSTRLQRCVDRPFSYQIFFFHPKIAYLNKPFYNYNNVPGSITNANCDNILKKMLFYLVEIKRFSNKHSALIAQHAILSFFAIWHIYYLKNGQGLKKIPELKTTLRSPWFKEITRNLNYKSISSKITKLESFLFLHSMTLPLYLHAIKWMLYKKR